MTVTRLDTAKAPTITGFPGSAKLGLYPGQVDPGWWTLSVLEKLHLVWNIKQPRDLAWRKELKKVGA